MDLTNILIIIGLILVILELFTVTTLLVWIGIGFVGAGIVSMYTENVFILITFGTLLCLGTMVIFRSRFKEGLLSGKQQKTSYEELLGKKAKIIDPFIGDDVDRGLLKINGVEWIAMAKDKHQYETGDIVKIIKIDGAKMYVSKEEEL